MPRRLLLGLLVALVTGCPRQTARPVEATWVPVLPSSPPAATAFAAVAPSASPVSPPYEVGLATWYGAAFAGHKTSNGERFDPNAMTAAHKTLPFGTWVEVRRKDTGESVRVRVTDRGPWGDARRIIDVSQAAARILGMLGVGVVPVELRVVTGP